MVLVFKEAQPPEVTFYMDLGKGRRYGTSILDLLRSLPLSKANELYSTALLDPSVEPTQATKRKWAETITRRNLLQR